MGYNQSEEKEKIEKEKKKQESEFSLMGPLASKNTVHSTFY